VWRKLCDSRCGALPGLRDCAATRCISFWMQPASCMLSAREEWASAMRPGQRSEPRFREHNRWPARAIYAVGSREATAPRNRGVRDETERRSVANFPDGRLERNCPWPALLCCMQTIAHQRISVCAQPAIQAAFSCEHLCPGWICPTCT
jgi:hypothetical protein